MLSRHLRARGNGTLRLSDARVSAAIQFGVEQGIPHKVFRELRASLEITNDQIVEGELLGGLKLVSPGFPAVTEREFQARDLDLDQRAVRTCRGKSGSRFHWWGVRIYLNSCQASNLIYLCTRGAGAAALCNKIDPIPCRVAGFLLLIMAGSMLFIGVAEVLSSRLPNLARAAKWVGRIGVLIAILYILIALLPGE